MPKNVFTKTAKKDTNKPELQPEKEASKENAFTKKIKTDLHSDMTSGDKMVKKSFSMYNSDLESINFLTNELQKHHRRKLKASAVIRVALDMLKEITLNGTDKQKELMKESIKKSL